MPHPKSHCVGLIDSHLREQGPLSRDMGHTTSTDYGGLSHLTELDATHICSSMEPMSATILALVDKSGLNPLLDALQSLLQDPDPDWVYPSHE